MLKNISNLGKTLNKAEQQSISGGRIFCTNHLHCPPNQCCQSPPTSNSGFCGASQNNEGLCNGQIPHDPIF